MNKYKPSGFIEKEPVDNLSKIENEIPFSRIEYLKNLLYKNSNREIHFMYNGKERKGVIVDESSSDCMIIGLLKEE